MLAMLVPALLLVAALPSGSNLRAADSGAEMCRRGHTDMCRMELSTKFRETFTLFMQRKSSTNIVKTSVDSSSAGSSPARLSAASPASG